MIRANFGFVAAAVGMVTAFGTNARAAVWEHQGTNNTAYTTSERMTGNDIDGIDVNVSGDNLWAFTGVANSQFITIISPPSNQPGVVYVLDKDGKPFPTGSGYNDLNGEGVLMTVDVGTENVGKEITFVFGNFGMQMQNDATSTVLFDSYDCGQIDPDAVLQWTGTIGENQFSSETRVYFFGEGEVRGVPKVSSTIAGVAAHNARAQRCCD